VTVVHTFEPLDDDHARLCPLDRSASAGLKTTPITPSTQVTSSQDGANHPDHNDTMPRYDKSGQGSPGIDARHLQ
jgi:hypothetical protein